MGYVQVVVRQREVVEAASAQARAKARPSLPFAPVMSSGRADA